MALSTLSAKSWASPPFENEETNSSLLINRSEGRSSSCSLGLQIHLMPLEYYQAASSPFQLQMHHTYSISHDSHWYSHWLYLYVLQSFQYNTPFFHLSRKTMQNQRHLPLFAEMRTDSFNILQCIDSTFIIKCIWILNVLKILNSNNSYNTRYRHNNEKTYNYLTPILKLLNDLNIRNPPFFQAELSHLPLQVHFHPVTFCNYVIS